MSVRRFTYQTEGIDWYCEQRGAGPPVVLVPSGEGDCSSFDKVAAALADQFTVLTFDMPGFSRSRVSNPDLVSVPLQYLFANVMNDDPAAWEALGEEYHARLAANYVTWVRRYVAPGISPEQSPEDLAGKPITWTIGGLTTAMTFLDNVVVATKAGHSISPLMCKHFPQVCAPDMLAQHIRTNATLTP
jgi:hypothetical protein